MTKQISRVMCCKGNKALDLERKCWETDGGGGGMCVLFGKDDGGLAGGRHTGRI